MSSAPHSLLKAAKAAWLDAGTGRPHRFHHVSTDEVYGSLGPEDAAFSETTPYAPNSPYSASKAGSDHLVRAYHHTYGLETTVSNCSNNYGPYQFPEKLIPLFVLNALSGRPLPIYGDGMNVRDWLHVEDHCAGIGHILRGGRPGEVYNVGGGQELPNLQVVEEICRGVDAAFAADPGLAQRFPDAPAARGAPTRASRPMSRTARGTTAAMRSTRPRSAASWAMPRRATSRRASPRRSPGISRARTGGPRSSIAPGPSDADPRNLRAPLAVNILGCRGVPAAHGGFETFAARLAPYLVRHGWDVTVYCQEDVEPGASYAIHSDSWEGVHRRHVPVRRGGPAGTIEFDWRATADVQKRAGVDLVLGYNTAVFCARSRLGGRRQLINMDGIEWKRAKWSAVAKTCSG